MRWLSGALLAGLLGGASYAVSQEDDWFESLKRVCAAQDADGACSLRRQLLEDKERASNPMVRAIRMALVEAARDPAGLGEISRWAQAVGRPPQGPDGHRAALQMALGLKTESAFWLALGHVQALLDAGETPAALAPYAKKLKLEMSGGGLATAEGSVLQRIKQISDGMEAAEMARKARSDALSYCAAVVLLKGLESKRAYAREAEKILKPLRRRWPAHVDAVLAALTGLGVCPSCRDRKKIVCAPCGGKGRRTLVCQQCDGEGQIKWDKNIPKTEKRQEYDNMLKMMGRLKDGYSYCPACIARPDATKRDVDCEFCGKTGVVECQRCKWWKLSIGSVGKLEACGNCAGTGIPLANVAHPCAFCLGAGELLIPNADPEATVAPLK